MNFPITINTIRRGLFIIYFKQVTGRNFHMIISLQSLIIVSVLANSVDPDEMPHVAAFYLGLHCLPKYHLRGFQYTKILKMIV